MRLLSAQVKALGYDVLIDTDLDYGDSLSGFMRRVIEARHVLMIVDDNYTNRVDNIPESGVAIENEWISKTHPDKPPTWVSVLFKDNPERALPKWIIDHNPKGHWFNANPKEDDFPGSEQIEDLWRWIEGLPTNRDNATPIETLRKRAARLERIETQRDPANWRNPSLADEVHFPFAKAPSQTYRMGHSIFEFAFQLSDRGNNTVAVYADPVSAVGLVRPKLGLREDLEAHLTPGRVVDAGAGDVVVLMNDNGVLCRVEIIAVQSENASPYVEPHVDFRYEIITQP